MTQLFVLSFFLLLGVPTLCSCQQVTSDSSTAYYKTKLLKSQDSGVTIDTLVTLDYLISSKDWVVTNLDRFIGFNYPLLSIKSGNQKVILYNDSIELIVKEMPFDAIKAKRNLSTDASYYETHPCYGLDGIPFQDGQVPSHEVALIELSINKQLKKISPDTYENFFDPSLRNCLAYVTEQHEIILTMENSLGAGFYLVILEFDSKGTLQRKIVQPVL
ncbi:MAG: hypothetical protein K0R51_443 [Cytophagaceae bacterium]|jgi:hypothetical protein|nr:hypothetical protein [Cytophagaceae bacterium]